MFMGQLQERVYYLYDICERSLSNTKNPFSYLGVVHILRNQQRGRGFPNAYGRLRGGGGGWPLIT